MKELEVKADELKQSLETTRSQKNSYRLRAAGNSLSDAIWKAAGEPVTKSEHFYKLQKRLAEAITHGRIKEAKDLIDELFAI